MINMAPGAVRLRLREVLKELGWSQKRLSDASGISRQTIIKLMQDPSAIRLDTLQRLCDATGREVADLLVKEENSADA